ncbi:MAG: choline dehydrogenase [Gomphosphaeria aponina SAG 52.96 = DSM 107014]|uniref:Choline dehydrogenase n=1 Tax=Gomphosphaeria aponina SAG 52.96 = DSM 107014 TaxID=1521640 RepID=A0A941GSD2_9CHRO|nr:choline dehydrogenase [Gomphosphaeria aponina SAG 52.96 = DSM 107014]
MTYDYIIVGGGTAGCVLANRLTENHNITVLLLEAGKPDRKAEIHIPAAFSKLFKTEYDWSYYTEPQTELNNRQLFWPRGKVLGGCSSINANIYIRGHRLDYDYWEELGNEGWSYAELLPYFKKAEHQERGASEYHGIGGYLNVGDRPYTNPLSHAFVAAGAEIGIPGTDDFNCAEPEGVGLYQVTIKNGNRHSAATAYLKPVINRANLTIRTGALVTRLLFNGKRVIGVEYIRDGVKQEVHIYKEVILSAGAVNSPQLLMVSGIGDGSHLQDLGIDVIVDLPGVGQNLQDHLVAGIVYKSTQPVSLDKADKIGNLLQYLLFKTGPLTSNVGEAGGFVKSQPDLIAPDLQFLLAPACFVNHGFTKLDGYGFTIGATLLQPESRGYVGLRSPDVLQPPMIQPNYLSAAQDLQVLVAGIQIGRFFANASAFDEFRGEEVLPGLAGDVVGCIRETAETLYHPVGTCKMGKEPMAVVNSSLQVYGVEGLRVVDGSIMPSIVRGNTNAPIMAIAEKAADLLKFD